MLFTNEDFLTSLGVAHWHIFGPVVFDQGLFSGAKFNTARLFNACCSQNATRSVIDDIFGEHYQTDTGTRRFVGISKHGYKRVDFANWPRPENDPTSFQHSPDLVFEWPPIADQLQAENQEISAIQFICDGLVFAATSNKS